MRCQYNLSCSQTPYKILKYFHDNCVVTEAHKIEESIYNVLLMY